MCANTSRVSVSSLLLAIEMTTSGVTSGKSLTTATFVQSSTTERIS